MTGNLFCFGFGYSARALARLLREDGWIVAGSSRSEEAAQEIARDGFEVLPFDGRTWSPALIDRVARADCVLVSTPPGETGDPVLAQGATILRPMTARWYWLGYLSTTGVYGDRKGAWVDERTAPMPVNARSALRLAAEIAWRCFAADRPLHVFRLAGIYGPGRNPFDALKAGTARRFDKPGQVFSRIHVDDLARVLRASLALPSPGAIYNVCDDEPASQADVIAHAAGLLGIAPPPLEPYASAAPGLSAMARSFYGESKRVRNDRMKRELGIDLLYPTYRDGLEALFRRK